MFRDRIPHARTTRAGFARDERGAVLVLWALFLAVAFGFLALAFDLGRIATTQAQLQSFADQVALAAAGELDGRADSITRATAAANGLIDGQQTYANGSQALGGSGDYTLTFLSTLPASDTVAATSVTTDGRLARYVRVDVNQRTVLTPFAHVNAVLNGDSQISAGIAASATAGFTAFACDITPLFFCVPSGWRASSNIGNQILLRSGGGNSKKNTADEVVDDPNAAWGPGNFGFINPSRLPVDPTGPCGALPANSAQMFRCLVGAERAVTSCIETRSALPTKTGQIQGLAGAFNSRFDIFLGGNKYDEDPAFQPAPNVVWGRTTTNGQCAKNNNQLVDSQADPLPRDGNITLSTRFGNGVWDRAAYLTTNHGNASPFQIDDLNLDGKISRYETYRAEIVAAGTSNPILPNLGVTPYESGRAICHKNGAISDPDRRVVVAAAVECGPGNDPRGQSEVVATEFVKMFLTEPVGSNGSDFDIWAEVVGTAGGAGSGALNGVYQDFIQLYR
jgi:Flp pilus assembly protein TadG